MPSLRQSIAAHIPAGTPSAHSLEAILTWLGGPTETTCEHCGQQALRRFEVLNGRCERCRIAYLAAIEEQEGAPRYDRDCSRCHGTGWRETEASRFGRCRCGARDEGDLILQRLSRAGVPPRYYPCTWTTWEGERPTEARQFTADPKGAGMLYVHGLQGRGKTHLATAVFRELLGRGMDCQWRDCQQLVDACRRWLANGRNESLDDELMKLYDAELVLLDDLGSGRQTVYAEDVIDGLIRYRDSRVLPTIITSNRDRKGLVTPVAEGGLGRDPAIASRLRGLTIHVQGLDRRAVRENANTEATP